MAAQQNRVTRQEAGRWLRDERRRRGYETVGALARALQVDPSRISQYETGNARVPDERATQIAEVFRMSEIEVRRRLGLWVPPESEGEGDEKPHDRLERLWREYRDDPGERGTVLRGLLETWADRDTG
jgi:transcriptional regulator with XRE-family HTH domain